MYWMDTSNRTKMPHVRLCDQARASIFTQQKLIAVKILLHIVFLMRSFLPKDLEPLLLSPGSQNTDRRSELTAE